MCQRRREHGNQGKKYLPAAAESMKQHERRAVSRTFGIVQLNIADVDDMFYEAWINFIHSVLARTLNAGPTAPAS